MKDLFCLSKSRAYLIARGSLSLAELIKSFDLATRAFTLQLLYLLALTATASEQSIHRIWSHSRVLSHPVLVGIDLILGEAILGFENTAMAAFEFKAAERILSDFFTVD